MAKRKMYRVELSKIELQAAFRACSNYVGGAEWKEKAQSRVAKKLEAAFLKDFYGIQEDDK